MTDRLPPRIRHAATALKARWLGLPAKRRRLLGVAAAVLALFLLTTRFLPEAGLRWGLFETMRKLGMTEVSLTDADVKLFDGRLVVKSFAARSAIGKALGLDHLDFAFRWSPLLRREISVESLELSGLAVSLERQTKRIFVNGAEIDLGGEGGAAPPSRWSFDIDDFKLADSRIDLADGAMKLTIEVERLEIRALKSAEPEAWAEIYFKGRIGGNPVLLSGRMTPFAEFPSVDLTLSTQAFDPSLLKSLLGDRLPLDIAGDLSATLSLSGSPMTTLEGKGQIEASSLSLIDGAAKVEGARLAVVADAFFWDANEARLSWQGALSAQSLSLDDGAGFSASPLGLSWKGKAEAVLGQNRQTLNLDGALAMSGFSLATKDVGLKHGALEAKLNLAAAGGRKQDARMTANLALDAKGFALRDLAGKRDLLSMPKIVAKSIRLDDATLKPDGAISAEALRLDDLDLALVLPKRKGGKDRPSGGEGEGEGKGEIGPRLALGQFAIGGVSRVAFTDRTPSRPVELTAEDVKLSLKNLDSQQPDRNSPFEISARVGHAAIKADGWAQPFADRATAKLEGRVKAFELPPLSPYMADAMGVELETGHFDGTVALSLDRGAIAGKLDVALANLFAAQPDPEAPIAKQTGMPVALLLDLLRGEDDLIKVTVPLGGDLSDPQFDLGDAIGQAIGGALKHTAVTTLKLVFPVLLLIDEIADQQSPPLAPVTFKPGLTEPDAPGQIRLAALAELLKGRPGIKLSLCPKASLEADWPALLEHRKLGELGMFYKMQKLVGVEAKPEKTPPDEEALSDLAQHRADAVKTGLAEGAGIDPGRLFACRPQIDSQAKALPRVEPML